MSERTSRWDAPSSSTSGAAADTKPSDAATAAAAIAAKIAASLRPGVAGNELVRANKEEGDFVRDIEINDLRNRYVLTKGPTQKQVSEHHRNFEVWDHEEHNGAYGARLALGVSRQCKRCILQYRGLLCIPTVMTAAVACMSPT